MSSCGLKMSSALKRAVCGPTITDLTSCTLSTSSSLSSSRTTPAVRSGTACPRPARARWMMKTATQPSIPPTAIEPAASNAGLPVSAVRPMPAAATPTPTTATESSSSTAGLSGSGPCLK